MLWAKTQNHKYVLSTLKKYLYPKDFGIEIEGVKGIQTEEKSWLDNEIRMRWSEYGTVVKLYEKFMKHFHNFDYDYGVHIHIDCRDWAKTEQYHPYYFNQLLIQTLIDTFKYVGEYNSHCASFNKNAVKYHQAYSTLEYRIISMPASWAELVKDIMVCQYATKITKEGKKITEKEKQQIAEFMSL